MKNCYLVKIPFSTKGEIRKINNSLKIIGYANYIYDYENNSIIHEYLELTKANYRLTDKRMIKPTSYYLKPKTKKFRDSILDPFTNHNLEKTIDIKFNDLNKEQLLLINSYLKLEVTTIREQFSYLQGSNISGAKLNSKASPLVCREQEYFGSNFANPMKKMQGKQNLNYKIIDTISLINFVNNNTNFKNIFEKSNKWLFNDLQVKSTDELSSFNSEDQYIENNFENWVYPFDLDEQISNYIDAYLNGVIEKNDKKIHKRKLRNFFGSSVKKALDNNKIPFCSMKTKIDSSVIENAHIISFAKLVDLNTKDSILKAINPFNVLRINSDNHKLFDCNKITFDSRGNIIWNNNIKEIKPFLDIENLPQETINFLEENYEYWNTNKVNK